MKSYNQQHSSTNAPNLNPKRMWDGSEWFWKILQGEKLIRHIRQAWKTNVQIRFRIRKKNSSIAISALINMGCLEKNFRYKEYHKYIVNIIWTNNAVAFFNGWVNGVVIYFIYVHKKRQLSEKYYRESSHKTSSHRTNFSKRRFWLI